MTVQTFFPKPVSDPASPAYLEFYVSGLPMANTSRDRLRGTLELLVLRTLAWGPSHGYAIVRWLEDNSANAVRVEEGSLYPALYRMEQRGLIASDWKVSELGRPAKFYRLTAVGRRHLKSETAEWLSFAAAVKLLLEPAS